MKVLSNKDSIPCRTENIYYHHQELKTRPAINPDLSTPLLGGLMGGSQNLIAKVETKEFGFGAQLVH